MTIRIKVDDHEPETVERESSMTVGGAVKRAYADKPVGLRPMGPQDDITINGLPTKYGKILTPQDENAKIRVKTEAWQEELAHIDEHTE